MTQERLVTFLTAFEDSQDSRRPGLSYSNFTSLFSRTMGIPENSQSIQVLCKKVRVAYNNFQSILSCLIIGRLIHLERVWLRETPLSTTCSISSEIRMLKLTAQNLFWVHHSSCKTHIQRFAEQIWNCCHIHTSTTHHYTGNSLQNGASTDEPSTAHLCY